MALLSLWPLLSFLQPPFNFQFLTKGSLSNYIIYNFFIIYWYGTTTGTWRKAWVFFGTRHGHQLHHDSVNFMVYTKEVIFFFFLFLTFSLIDLCLKKKKSGKRKKIWNFCDIGLCYGGGVSLGIFLFFFPSIFVDCAWGSFFYPWSVYWAAICSFKCWWICVARCCIIWVWSMQV